MTATLRPKRSDTQPRMMRAGERWGKKTAIQGTMVGHNTTRHSQQVFFDKKWRIFKKIVEKGGIRAPSTTQVSTNPALGWCN